MINFDLLDGAITDAETEARGYKHLQDNWVQVLDRWAPSAEACGTGLCLFGFAAIRAGAKPPQPEWDEWCEEWYFPYWCVTDSGEAASIQLDDGVRGVAEFAQDRLGLTDGQASALSYGGNTLDEIRRMRDALHRNPDATEGDLYRAAALESDD